MTEETGMEKDSVYEGDNAPNEIITESGLDGKQADKVGSSRAIINYLNGPAARIKAGYSDLEIFKGNMVTHEGYEAQEFFIEGFSGDLRAFIWSDGSNNFVEVIDKDAIACSLPTKIDSNGTYVDLVKHPQVGFEILGCLVNRERIMNIMYLAIDAIHLIQEDHDRVHDSRVLDRIFDAWVDVPDDFTSGMFAKLVEHEVSKDAVRLLPELDQKCVELMLEDITKTIASMREIYEWHYL